MDFYLNIFILYNDNNNNDDDNDNDNNNNNININSNTIIITFILPSSRLPLDSAKKLKWYDKGDVKAITKQHIQEKL